MPVEAPAAVVSPTSRPDAPTSHGEVKNDARGKAPGAQQGNSGPSQRHHDAKQQLRDAAQRMSRGEVTSATAPIQPGEPATQPQGRHQPRPQDPAAGNTGANAPKPPVDPATQTPEAKAAAVETSKKVLAAKRILLRDGWEPKELAAMPDDKIIGRAELRKQHHAETDRIVGEHAQLKRAQPQPRADDGTFAPKTPDPAVKPGESPAQAAPPTQTGNPTVDGLLSQLEAKAGAETAGIFRQLITAVQSNSSQEAQSAAFLAKSIMVQQGKAKFVELYPDLATENPAAFEGASTLYGDLLQTGRYTPDTLDKAWTDALFIACGPPNVVQNVQRGMLARQAGAVAGQLDPGTQHEPVASAEAPSKRELLKKAGELMKANPKAGLEQLRQTVASWQQR